MDDDKLVKYVIGRYWSDEEPRAVLQVIEAALRDAIEKAREDEAEQHRYAGFGEDE